MKELGIPFMAPMVRAVLANTKTQTRRIVNPQPPADIKEFCAYHHPKPGHWLYGWDEADKSLMEWSVRSPYGAPGDGLWVREAWRVVAEADSTPPRDLSQAHRVWFESDEPHQPGFGKYRPAMFMCRWMSRINLVVTGVRIERLQDISETDAIAEGIEERVFGSDPCRWRVYGVPDTFTSCPVTSYQSLWESINGAGNWDTNPWVWVIEFAPRPSPSLSLEKS
jgi:hypothetical protein